MKVAGREDLVSQSGIVQDIDNIQLIAKTDVIVAVLRHKLSTPTNNNVSGTAKEILFALIDIQTNLHV